MSLEDADKLTPQIHLSKIINSLAPSDIKTKRLIVMSPSYMKNITDILSSTPKDVLQTYLLWKTIQKYASVIEADELKPYSRFMNKLQGKVRYPFLVSMSTLIKCRILILPLNVGGLV
jgi:endothelin-converting enzyme